MIGIANPNQAEGVGVGVGGTLGNPVTRRRPLTRRNRNDFLVRQSLQDSTESESEDSLLEGRNNNHNLQEPPAIQGQLEALIRRAVQAQNTTTNPDQNYDIYSRNFKLFLSLFLFRALNSLFVNTWFDPDETWQSLEVAHHTVWGVGAITWEWKLGIRSAAHPMLFVGLYKVIQLCGLEHSDLLIIAPRLFQAIFAALTDLYTFLLSLRLFGLESARLTLTCMLMSWFNFYCLVRTYSNSMEAAFTIIALYYWPSPRTPATTRRDFRISLTMACIGCIFRPTNALVWIFLGIHLLQTYPHRMWSIVFDTVVTGVFGLGVSLLLDRLFYDRWVFTQWQFLRVNVLEKISQFYGTHPFHWYFSQGVPLVLYTSLPFCIYGAFKLKHTHKRQFFWMCFAVTIVLSFQDHKEFRFLLPLLAPMQIYAGRALYLIHKADINNGRTGIKSLLTRCLVFMSLANFILALYFSRIHKRGVVQVVEWIRRQAYYSRYNKLVDNSVTHTKVESVLFLMPCHSTPFYSTVHLEIPMRYVTCEPPLGRDKQERSVYKDETDLLYTNPSDFISKYFSKHVGNKTLDGIQNDPGYIYPVQEYGYSIEQYEWPSHLVWYDNPRLGHLLDGILHGSDYEECARFANGLFHDDAKQFGNVVVSCRKTG